jgi:hypothetical protein
MPVRAERPWQLGVAGRAAVATAVAAIVWSYLTMSRAYGHCGEICVVERRAIRFPLMVAGATLASAAFGILLHWWLGSSAGPEPGRARALIAATAIPAAVMYLAQRQRAVSVVIADARISGSAGTFELHRTSLMTASAIFCVTLVALSFLLIRR